MSDGAVPLLDVRGLTVSFFDDDVELNVLREISLRVDAARTLALVGESGCGKSVTALAIMRLLDPAARVMGGSVRLRGKELLSLPEADMQRVRGSRIGMVFQEPMTSLNPVIAVGRQIEEVLRLHLDMDARTARRRAVELLERVHMPSAAQRARQYPHELSGGMKQRVMIAMALACSPGLLIADEPTTALDVTIQLQILALLRELQRELGMGVVLITHNLGVVAQFADEVAVMYAGQIVEHAPVSSLFDTPRHPYTRALLRSLPGAAPTGSTLHVIEGAVPAPRHYSAGCRFVGRCDVEMPQCASQVPRATRIGDATVSCWQPAEAVPA